MADLIPNNQRLTRQVIFDRNNQVMTIQTAKRNPPATTTYQVIDKLAAFILSTIFLDKNFNQIPVHHTSQFSKESFRIEYTHDRQLMLIFNDFSISVRHEFTNPETTPLGAREIGDVLNVIPSPVKDYLLALNPPGERFNLVPDGYGWDGKHSNSELIRANKVKSLLIGEYEWKGFDNSLVEMICSEALFTPSKSIVTDWRKAILFNPGDVLIVGGVNPNTKVYVFGQTPELSELLTVSLGIDDNYCLTYTPDNNFDRFVIVSTAMIKKPEKADYGVRVKLYEKIKHEQSG